MYALRYDQSSAILHLRLTEFWTEDTMRDFLGEFLPLVQRLARTEPGFAILSDCRDYPVQSSKIGAAWARILGPDTSITAPYAVVVGSMLNKLQAERALTAPNVAIFAAMDDATAWLHANRNGATSG